MKLVVMTLAKEVELTIELKVLMVGKVELVKSAEGGCTKELR